MVEVETRWKSRKANNGLLIARRLENHINILSRHNTSTSRNGHVLVDKLLFRRD
jgi:hypothetical protein